MNIFSSAFASGWQPIDRRPISEWALENILLPSGAVFDPPGPLDLTASPYLLGPLAAIDDDSVRFITAQGGVQTGKSLIGDAAICHIICTRPQNIFLNLPTEKQADSWAKRRLMKLLHAPGPVAKLIQGIREVKRHSVTNTQIMFSNMWIAVQAANETNLQGTPCPISINEELWEFEPAMYQHAIARTDHFEWRSKIINISQAGILNSDMDQAYKAGTQELWEVPCLHCDRYHNLPWTTRLPDKNGKPVWAGITWDSTAATRPGGVWHFDALKPTIRITCPHCGQTTPDDPALRRKMNALGRTRITNPNAPRNNRSFQWPSWASEKVSLAAVVEQYLRAKDQEKLGNRVPLREWYQKRAALSYDSEAHRTFDLAPAIELEDRKSEIKNRKFWQKQDLIFGCFDIQRDHMWGLVEAWSNTGESMVLWAGKLLTWQDIEDKQTEFAIPHRCMFVDARHRPHEVYKQCTLHGQAGGRHTEWICWTAIMGDPRRHFVFRTNKGRRLDLPYSWPPQWADPCLGLLSDDPDLPTLRGRQCPLIYFAKGTIDPMSFERRELLMRGSVSLMAKGDWNEEFCKQLHGEMPETIVTPLGYRLTKSKCLGPNHLLDCYRMSLTAACMAQILGDKRPE